MGGQENSVEFRLSLQLPRDEMSVPVARNVAGYALDALGVQPDFIDDIKLALSEATTNVLRHTRDGDVYEIALTTVNAYCVIEVIDRGHGFAADDLGHGDAAIDAEEGRGIQLMRALVDRLHFESRPEQGTIVRLEKRLALREGAPIERLAVADGEQPAVAEPLG